MRGLRSLSHAFLIPALSAIFEELGLPRWVVLMGTDDSGIWRYIEQ